MFKMLNKKIFAFSIAEAMVTLTIFAVVAGASAPLISKQIKINSASDVYANLLNKKIDDLNKASDVYANLLNKKIDDLNKGKWSLASDDANVTRPSGTVGVGVSTGTNPSAKLHVVSSSNENIDMFKVQKGTGQSPLSIDRNGIISFRSLGDDATSRIVFKDNDGVVKASMTNAGVMKLMPSEQFLVFQAHNVNNAPDSEKYVYMKSDGKTVSNTVLKNLGFAVYGNGAIRMNYEETVDEDRGINNTASGGPIAIYVDGGYRFGMNEAGGTIFSFALDDKRGAAYDSIFVVRTCENNCGPDAAGTYNSFLNVKKDGTTVLKSLNVNGDIKQNGTSIASMMDERVARVNSELAEYKDLVLELKKQNELLSQKVAMLEQNTAIPIFSELRKLALKK